MVAQDGWFLVVTFTMLTHSVSIAAPLAANGKAD
jgi:hypothetical protein